MQRRFLTTDEQDAAIAWDAARQNVTEAAIIATFADAALRALVNAYRDAEAARVFEKFRTASPAEKAAAMAALNLDGK